MARPLPIIGIIAGALAAVSALVLVDLANLVLVPVILAASVFLFMLRDRSGIILGVTGVVLAVVGTMGLLQNVSTEDGGMDFGISPSVGHALLIAGAMVASADIVWRQWGDFQTWQSAVGAGVVGLTALLAVGLRNNLTDQTQAGAFVVAIFALLSMGPAVMALRQS